MPSIPKLDLTRVIRDEDEDDEDFENKVGSDAAGVLKQMEFVQERQKPLDIPLLALPGVNNEDMRIHRSQSQTILPKAHPALRKSKRNLAMYCDDLTLMLLKQRRPGRKPTKLYKPSAVQLPPVHNKEAPRMSQSTELVEERIVHAHFHYHYHLPGLQAGHMKQMK